MFEGINIIEFLRSLIIVGGGLTTLIFAASRLLGGLKPFKDFYDKKKNEKEIVQQTLDKTPLPGLK